MLQIVPQTPQKALNAELVRFSPQEKQFERFRGELIKLRQNIDEADRENRQEIYVLNFLNEAFYRGKNEVNKKEDIDLAIHGGDSKNEPVAVIIEAKRPTGAEMISVNQPNAKALHQAILYFLRERVDAKNDDLKFIIITNIKEWFVFKAADFNKLFYENAKFRKSFENWRDRNKISPNTSHFYDEIAKPFIAALDGEIEAVYFDLQKIDLTDEKALSALWKIFSPFYLLKESLANDSNTLDKNFYNELLHIIGLEEVKEKNKYLIRRKKTPDAGSLIEKAIAKLETEYFVFPQEMWKSYGQTRGEQIYNAALELCIVWINRILFLKLLESQLVNYHEGDKAFSFLNVKTVNNFNELYRLFHDVLNTQIPERNPTVKEKYARVPYLNSSLFDFADVERDTIRINAIDDNIELNLLSTTVLRNETAQALPTLEYLYKFLDAYDFASEGKQEIRKEMSGLINASVLGKVFEKINGYKDGSIYTPGFITMYMCRQAIRLAVVQKFKDETDFDSDSFDDLEVFTRRHYKTEDIKRFNRIINRIKICDPAVGSGHFLVSALNEILAIKSQLGIFADEAGKPFSRYEIKVGNDELVVTDAENLPFEYKIRDGKPLTDEMQKLQKTLFHEKQRLIENCLFGVDINPNSVKICRLRLWIELLKNAYYKNDGRNPHEAEDGRNPHEAEDCRNPHEVRVNDTNQREARVNDSYPHDVLAEDPNPYFVRVSAYSDLETLPNIDINIKEGNSLISRFALDADLREVLGQMRFGIEDYQGFVRGYKETRDREAKRDFEAKIRQIKEDFKTRLFHFSPERIKLADLKNQLRASESKQFLFGETDEEKARRGQKEAKLKADIEKQEAAIKAVEENAVYQNAFEWRFEFPEVLDNEGNFQGFDIVIGNPPYIRQEELGDLKTYLKPNYRVFAGTADILVYFYELGLRILKERGSFSFITSNKFMRANYGKALREFLGAYRLNEIIDFGDAPVFGGIAAYASIVNLEKCETFPEQQTRVYTFPVNEEVSDFETSYRNDAFAIPQTELKPDGWRLESAEVLNLLAKLRSKGKPLGEYVNGRFYRGVVTGLNDAFVVDRETRDRLIAEDANSAEIIKPYVRGRDIKRWQIDSQDLWLCFIGWHFETEKYPAIFNHLKKYEQKLKSRPEVREGKVPWYAMSRYAADYWQEFEKPKIILPTIEKQATFTLDPNGFYGNDKTNICISPDAPYLAAILNSSVSSWIIKQTASSKQGGYYELKPMYITQIPIPEISPEEQKPFIELVDEILARKKAGAETIDLEDRIDEMVFDLYELTEDEKKIVKGAA